MTNWTPTACLFPREGEVVETISATGTVQRLKLIGGLWFVEDGSMYVYYVPTFWRDITS